VATRDSMTLPAAGFTAGMIARLAAWARSASPSLLPGEAEPFIPDGIGSEGRLPARHSIREARRVRERSRLAAHRPPEAL
jgi:hypothetical protein